MIALVLVAALAADAQELHVVRFGPGCVGSKSVSVNVAGALFEPMAARNGGYFIQALNIGALMKDNRLLFSEPEHFADPLLASRFVAHKGEVKREILEEKLPVLVGASDFAFQYPVRGHADYPAVIEDEAKRTGGFADAVRKYGRLVRLSKPGVEPVLALEIDK